MSISIGFDLWQLFYFFPGHISYGCGSGACHFRIGLLGFFIYAHVEHQRAASEGQKQ